MNETDPLVADSPPAPPPTPVRRGLAGRVLRIMVGLLAIYLVLAYLLMPDAWKHYTRRHPGLEDIPRICYAADGIPGDPLNVALVGSEAQLKRIMIAAKWYPADPLTLKSCLEIAEATVLKRPYDDAPVSSEYLFGRKEDLAFEQPVGNDPRKRHHVRFWRTESTSDDGEPIWVGAAIFDERVGLSHRTGQITHHTAPDIDAERDDLFKDLEATGDLAEFSVVDGFQKDLSGRNGAGDPWHTDGKLYVGVIAAKLK